MHVFQKWYPKILSFHKLNIVLPLDRNRQNIIFVRFPSVIHDGITHNALRHHFSCGDVSFSEIFYSNSTIESQYDWVQYFVKSYNQILKYFDTYRIICTAIPLINVSTNEIASLTNLFILRVLLPLYSCSRVSHSPPIKHWASHIYTSSYIQTFLLTFMYICDIYCNNYYLYICSTKVLLCL